MHSKPVDTATCSTASGASGEAHALQALLLKSTSIDVMNVVRCCLKYADDLDRQGCHQIADAFREATRHTIVELLETSTITTCPPRESGC